MLPEWQARPQLAILLPQDELQFLRVRSAKQEIMVSARRLPVSSAFCTCQTILSCHMTEAGISVSTYPHVQPPRLCMLGMLDALNGTGSWLCSPCVRMAVQSSAALRKCAFARSYHVMS